MQTLEERRSKVRQAILEKTERLGEVSTRQIKREFDSNNFFKTQGLIKIFGELASEGLGQVENRIGSNNKSFSVFVLNNLNLKVNILH